MGLCTIQCVTVTTSLSLQHTPGHKAWSANRQLIHRAVGKRLIFAAKRYRISTLAPTRLSGQLVWPSAQLKQIRWFCLCEAITSNTLHIRRTVSRVLPWTSPIRPTIKLTKAGTNFLKAQLVRAATTSISNRWVFKAALAIRIMQRCKTVKESEKAIHNHSHRRCSALIIPVNKLPTRIMVEATLMPFVSLWRAIWRTNSNSRPILATRQRILILLKAVARCLTRQTWIDLPSLPTIFTIQEICWVEYSSMGWGPQLMEPPARRIKLRMTRGVEDKLCLVSLDHVRKWWKLIRMAWCRLPRPAKFNSRIVSITVFSNRPWHRIRMIMLCPWSKTFMDSTSTRT